ncbi:MAG: hypothetical protein ACTSQE_04480 [Candidatus Heimdallarchaeaceae archaeon]
MNRKKAILISTILVGFMLVMMTPPSAFRIILLNSLKQLLYSTIMLK